MAGPQADSGTPETTASEAADQKAHDATVETVRNAGLSHEKSDYFDPTLNIDDFKVEEADGKGIKVRDEDVQRVDARNTADKTSFFDGSQYKKYDKGAETNKGSGTDTSQPQNRSERKEADAKNAESEKASAPAGDGYSSVSGGVIDSVMDPLTKIMSVQGFESEVVEAARKQVVSLINRLDVWRTNVDALGQIQVDTMNGRNQMVLVNDLLRKDPYMDELWYWAGQTKKDKVTAIYAQEGIITEIKYTKTQQTTTGSGAPPTTAEIGHVGGFDDIKNKQVEFPAIQRFDTIYRGTESYYQQFFQDNAAAIDAITDEAAIEKGASPQLSSSTLTNKDVINKWGLTEKDLTAKDDDKLTKGILERGKVDNGGTAYIKDNSGLTSMKDVVKKTEEDTQKSKDSSDAKTKTSEAKEDKDGKEKKVEHKSAAATGGGGARAVGGVATVPTTPLGSRLGGAGGASLTGTKTKSSGSSSKSSSDDMVDIEKMLDKFSEENKSAESSSKPKDEFKVPDGATPIYGSDGSVVGYVPADENSKSGATGQYGYYDPSTGEFKEESEPGYYDAQEKRWITVSEQQQQYYQEQQEAQAKAQEAQAAAQMEALQKQMEEQQQLIQQMQQAGVTPSAAPAAPVDTAAQSLLQQLAAQQQPVSESTQNSASV